MSLFNPRDVMIDIETIATRNDAAIIQIGACTFDEKHQFIVSVPAAYYDGEHPYHVDPRTQKWWSEQGEEAQEALKLNLVPNPGTALQELDKWLKSTGFQKSYKFTGRSVWANGVQFDCSILRYAYSMERGDNNATPWHYRQEKDSRTLYALFRKQAKVKDVDTTGLVKHRADHDCVRQARGVKLILESLS